MRQQQWSFHFGPGIDPRQQAEEMQRQREMVIRQMVDEKRCTICKNTYLVNDQITFCIKSNVCVDEKNGQSCPDWENLYG